MATPWNRVTDRSRLQVQGGAVELHIPSWGSTDMHLQHRCTSAYVLPCRTCELVPLNMCTFQMNLGASTYALDARAA